MADAGRRELDAIEAGPRGGKIDLFAFLKADDRGGRAGVALDASAKLSGRLSAFGRASAAREWDTDGSRWSVDALAGIRYRF